MSKRKPKSHFRRYTTEAEQEFIASLAMGPATTARLLRLFDTALNRAIEDSAEVAYQSGLEDGREK